MEKRETIVVWFSCGAASAVAAKLTIEKFAHTHNIIIANNPIKEEHHDNKRFLKDVEKWLGQEIISVINPKYPDSSCVDVWNDRKYMSGIAGAPCTGVLKKQARQLWERENKHDHIVLGFTYDEKDRHDRFVLTERSNVIPVLIDAKMTKQDCFEFINQAGLRLPEIYYLGYPNANCFAGDVRFITQNDGLISFRQNVGRNVRVLGVDGRWKDAICKRYGKQQLYRVILERNGKKHAIECTANHRWLIHKYDRPGHGFVETNTSFLKTGNSIPVSYAKLGKFDNDGVRNGIVYGDGSRYFSNNDPNGKEYCRLQLFGDKEILAKYFPENRSPGGCFNGLPSYLKDIPENKSVEYMTGFIIGLIATDGCVSKSGITVSTCKKDDAIKILSICENLGIIASLKSATRDTNYKKDSTVFNITMPKSCFNRDHILRTFHKDNFGEKRTNPKSYKVCIVEPLNKFEDVYCVEVDDKDKTFALEKNITTLNCVGCVKATSPTYWNHVKSVHPEIFKQRAKQSREIGARLVRVKGKRMFLDELRGDEKGKSMKSLKMPDCGIFCEES